MDKCLKETQRTGNAKPPAVDGWLSDDLTPALSLERRGSSEKWRTTDGRA